MLLVADDLVRDSVSFLLFDLYHSSCQRWTYDIITIGRAAVFAGADAGSAGSSLFGLPACMTLGESKGVGGRGGNRICEG